LGIATQTKAIVKQTSPIVWVLLLVVVGLAIGWFFSNQRNAEAERIMLREHKETIKQAEAEKQANAVERAALYQHIDSLGTANKKLAQSRVLSETRVITIYKDSHEKLDIIASAGRDSLRELFTSY